MVNENHLFRHYYSTLFSYRNSHIDQAGTIKPTLSQSHLLLYWMRPIKITITC